MHEDKERWVIWEKWLKVKYRGKDINSNEMTEIDDKKEWGLICARVQVKKDIYQVERYHLRAKVHELFERWYWKWRTMKEETKLIWIRQLWWVNRDGETEREEKRGIYSFERSTVNKRVTGE